MQWIAPLEKDAGNNGLEKRFWQAADQLRANSGLTAQQYSGPASASSSCASPQSGSQAPQRAGETNRWHPPRFAPR
jgi:hypothetical protein